MNKKNHTHFHTSEKQTKTAKRFILPLTFDAQILAALTACQRRLSLVK